GQHGLRRAPGNGRAGLAAPSIALVANRRSHSAPAPPPPPFARGASRKSGAGLVRPLRGGRRALPERAPLEPRFPGHGSRALFAKVVEPSHRGWLPAPKRLVA